MKSLLRALILSVIAFFLLGCQEEGPAAAAPQTPARQGPRPTATNVWSEVKQFGWGNAVIRPGMTKDEVLAQIEGRLGTQLRGRRRSSRLRGSAAHF